MVRVLQQTLRFAGRFPAGSSVWKANHGGGSSRVQRLVRPVECLTRRVGYRPCVVNVAAISVLVELGTATWSEPQAVAYETAQEGVRQAIGYYAHLISEAESAAVPDTAAIAGWREAQQAWAARGQELTPLETRAIKRIRADADDLLSVDADDEDDDDTDEDDRDRSDGE